MMQYTGTVVESSGSRVQVSRVIGEWSDTMYLQEQKSFVIGSSITFKVTEKKTSSSQRKYWKGQSCRMIVDDKFILARLRPVVGSMAALKIMHDSKIEFKDEASYIIAWVNHITDCKDAQLESLKQSLATVNVALYSELFISKLQEKGIHEKQAMILCDRLCKDDLHTIPDKVIDVWLSQPYSPYLTGLDITTRDCMYKGDERDGVRIRFLIHKILILHEQFTGSTFMNVNQVISKLCFKYQLIGFTRHEINCMSDDYGPLPGAKKKVGVRDPSLYIEGNLIQHLDVHLAETAIRAYWEEKNHVHDTSDLSLMSSGLNQLQIEAMKMVFSNRISCITGGPGRGKTFLITRICNVWRKTYGGNVVVVSAFHKPLENMKDMFSDLKGYQPMAFRTISSATYSPGRMMCECEFEIMTSGEPNPKRQKKDHAPSLLIIEESGVCTMLSMHAIMKKAFDSSKCCKWDDVHILMLGDVNQLKPIGPGQPMNDFIRLYPKQVTILDENMRSVAPNLNANVDRSILGNHCFSIGEDFVWRQDMFKLTNDNTNLFYKNFLQSYAIQHDVVITPSNADRHIFNRMLHNKHLDTLVDSPVLRKQLQSLTPHDAARFVVGTRVVCILTDEDDTGITNGMQGVICCNNNSTERMVDTGKQQLPFAPKLWHLAYCLTAHKGQGSEFDHVFVYTFGDFVARDWLYTSISRGKSKIVYLVPKQQHVAVIHRKPRKSASLI